MAISRWGSPAPSSPPMPVPEPERPMADVTYIPVRSVQAPPATPTAASLREQMQARAEELRGQLKAADDMKLELDLLEKMLEVK